MSTYKKLMIHWNGRTLNGVIKVYGSKIEYSKISEVLNSTKNKKYDYYTNQMSNNSQY